MASWGLPIPGAVTRLRHLARPAPWFAGLKRTARLEHQSPGGRASHHGLPGTDMVKAVLLLVVGTLLTTFCERSAAAPEDHRAVNVVACERGCTELP
jgi:hypothetical protein